MPHKRLYRSSTERRIAGVCGGIAEHFDVDPVWVRLGAVGLTLLPIPFVPIGYLVCWLIVPVRPMEEPGGTSSGQGQAGAGGATDVEAGSGPRSERDGTVIGGIIFISLGLFFLLMNFGILDWGFFQFWRWRYLWPVALILLGTYMVVRSVGAQRRARQR